MPWEYLQTKDLDRRFIEVAKYIDVNNQSLLDLNGGTCRFINFIPNTFSKYYANDIWWFSDNPLINFQKLKDDEMVDYLDDKHIDILLCFGLGAGHIVHNGWESETLHQSIKKIISKHKPSCIVLEASKQHDNHYHFIKELVDFCVGYEIKNSIHIPGTGYSERFAFTMIKS